MRRSMCLALAHRFPAGEIPEMNGTPHDYRTVREIGVSDVGARVRSTSWRPMGRRDVTEFPALCIRV